MSDTIDMIDTAGETDAQTLDLPMDAVLKLFEPWDGLDDAIDQLERATRTNAGAPSLVAAVVAAREALRSPLYAVLRAYQAAQAAGEDDGDEDEED